MTQMIAGKLNTIVAASSSDPRVLIPGSPVATAIIPSFIGIRKIVTNTYVIISPRSPIAITEYHG